MQAIKGRTSIYPAYWLIFKNVYFHHSSQDLFLNLVIWRLRSHQIHFCWKCCIEAEKHQTLQWLRNHKAKKKRRRKVLSTSAFYKVHIWQPKPCGFSIGLCDKHISPIDRHTHTQTHRHHTSPSILGGRMLDKWIVLYSPEFNFTIMASAFITCITCTMENKNKKSIQKEWERS